MLILNRPKAQIVVAANESDVTFPAVAIVRVTMSPLEFFGLEKLTGKLNIAPVGATLEMKRTDYRGPGRLLVHGSYLQPNFVSNFLGQKFRLNGNLATFKVSANSLADLDQFTSYIDALFPSIFSGAFHAPLEVEDISGTIQGFSFIFRSNLSIGNAVHITPASLPIKEHFDSFGPQEFVPSIFLISAIRYLQQADRLQAEGRYPTTFLAERILNVAKAIEAIFPGDVDGMRAELNALQVEITYIEIFASVKYLRNQVDVGHVSFSDLPNDSIQEVLNFSDLATSCLRTLINSLIRNQQAQEHLLKQRNEKTSGKPSNIIKNLKKYCDVLPPKDNNLSVLIMRGRKAHPTK